MRVVARGGKKPFILGAASPPLSLAPTSLRTRNCCLRQLMESTQGRMTRFRCPPAQDQKGAYHGSDFPSWRGTGCPQGDGGSHFANLGGRRVEQQTRRRGTMTREGLPRADWMAAQGVTHVAMESTGVFWKPIYNILESRFIRRLTDLVNARHLKQVPGRKSDVRDSQWIAPLLQHGLLKGSFIPPRPQRELRDLTRHRTQLVAEQTRVANRLHKVLEDANITLGWVARHRLAV